MKHPENPMKILGILVVERKEELYPRLVSLFPTDKYYFAQASTLEEAKNILTKPQSNINFGIIMLQGWGTSEQEFCKALRVQYSKAPLQVLVTTDSPTDLPLNGTIDDIIPSPIWDLELKLRIYLAQGRYEKQLELIQEWEFLRKTLKEEEGLSAKVLAQNRSLKQAIEDLERINEQLVKANRELERIARHDALSGLLNRITLFNAVDAEIERSLRGDNPLSGIMIDIDHFKDINDNYGHQCGDDVIRMIGNWLLGNLRKYDLAGRYGGEEFFVVLPNTRLNQAVKIAERFRKTVQSYTMKCNNHSIQITASMGVAEYRMGETRDMWINRCDRAMYVAKHRGRNQVVADTFPLGPASSRN
ncbi:MAG: GGDEF domain-containing protein [Spirochaetales bacterium]